MIPVWWKGLIPRLATRGEEDGLRLEINKYKISKVNWNVEGERVTKTLSTKGKNFWTYG